ncbi:sulfur carrier protein ThiS [Pirellulaceae bacterium SH467]|jgi:thiamine biosynthesis protein ThiS
MIQIQFNGEPQSIDPDTTLLQLLERFGVESRFCAVEINLDILPKPEYETYFLRDGDRVEVVTLVGGG